MPGRAGHLGVTGNGVVGEGGMLSIGRAAGLHVAGNAGVALRLPRRQGQFAGGLLMAAEALVAIVGDLLGRRNDRMRIVAG